MTDDEFTTIRIRTRVLKRVDEIARRLALRTDVSHDASKVSRSGVIELAIERSGLEDEGEEEK